MRYKKAIRAVVLLLVCSLAVYGCGSSQEKKYKKAQDLLLEQKYSEAIELFDSISTFGDASKYSLYTRALQAAENGDIDTAVTTFASLGDFADSSFYKTYYEADLLALSGEQDSLCLAENKYNSIPLFLDSKDKASELATEIDAKYKAAVKLVKNYDCEKAIDEFIPIYSYEDAAAYITYSQAITASENNDFDQAISKMSSLGDFEDASLYKMYFEATKLAGCDDYSSLSKAKKIYLENPEFLDSNERIDQIDTLIEEKYATARDLLVNKKYEEALVQFKNLSDYMDSPKYVSYIDLIMNLESGAIEYDEAFSMFSEFGDFEESEKYMGYCAAASMVFDNSATADELKKHIELLESISDIIDVSEVLVAAEEQLESRMSHFTSTPDIQYCAMTDIGDLYEITTTSRNLDPFVAVYQVDYGDNTNWDYICVNNGEGVAMENYSELPFYLQKYYIPCEPVDEYVVDIEGIPSISEDKDYGAIMISSAATISGPSHMTGLVFYDVIDNLQYGSYEDGILIPNMANFINKGEGEGGFFGFAKYDNLTLTYNKEISSRRDVMLLHFRPTMFAPLQEVNSRDFSVTKDCSIDVEETEHYAEYNASEELNFNSYEAGFVVYRTLLDGGLPDEEKEFISITLFTPERKCELTKFLIYGNHDMSDENFQEPQITFEVLGIVPFEKLEE